jgi:hypothetical protein
LIWSVYVEIKEECWQAQDELLLWMLPICPRQNAEAYSQAQGKS